jgi:mitosis inhibitor protein kinase SWE1
VSPASLESSTRETLTHQSLGILVLETALNVVLPPNGEGWINLRSDNFAELEEHYLPRPEGDYRSIDAESGMPLVSEELLRVVKGMMGSDPGARMALEDVTREEVFRRVKRAMEGGSGAALVEESDEWLGNVLPV